MKFAVIAVFFWVSQASACSCLDPKVVDAFKWADVVFTGQAVRVQYIDDKSKEIFDERRIIVTFQILAYWKGNVGQTITLHTVYNRVSCDGYFFKEGEKFIVYAKKDKAKEWLKDRRPLPTLPGVVYPKPDEDILGTGLCTRTNRLINANKDLEELGPVSK